MELNYSKERWEQIPDEIQELHSQELDFTDHPDRELHKLEMDRRLYLMSNFLPGYTWDGMKANTSDTKDYSSKQTTTQEKQEPQSALEQFVQEA